MPRLALVQALSYAWACLGLSLAYTQSEPWPRSGPIRKPKPMFWACVWALARAVALISSEFALGVGLYVCFSLGLGLGVGLALT